MTVPAESRMGRRTISIMLLFVVTVFLPAARAYPSYYIMDNAAFGCGSIPNSGNAVHRSIQDDP